MVKTSVTHSPAARVPLPLSSAEASLYCGEAFVLWGGWGERKRERAPAVSLFPSFPARFLFLSIIDILMGIPSGSLCVGESATSSFLRHFDVICDLLLNRRKATSGLRQHGIYGYMDDVRGNLFSLFFFQHGSRF